MATRKRQICAQLMVHSTALIAIHTRRSGALLRFNAPLVCKADCGSL
jgi:hypothetical protein